MTILGKPTGSSRLAVGVLLLAGASSLAQASPLSEKISAMSESGRRTFVGLIVRQSGEKCDTVRRTFFQGNLEKSAIWNVECNGGDKYAVAFYGDESNTTRVSKCSALKDMGAPACFKKI